jgi:hypothetical protein
MTNTGVVNYLAMVSMSPFFMYVVYLCATVLHASYMRVPPFFMYVVCMHITNYEEGPAIRINLTSVILVWTGLTSHIQRVNIDNHKSISLVPIPGMGQRKGNSNCNGPPYCSLSCEVKTLSHLRATNLCSD